MMARILIVEDDLLIAGDIAATLEDEGHVVVGTATDSGEVQPFLQAQDFDMVLLDINLTEADEGISLADHFNVPVIFLTSNSDKRTVSKAIQKDPAAYLTKPFNDRDLINTIELVLHKKQARGQGEPEDSIFIKDGDRFQKVLFEDILHIEADGSYSNIRCKHGKNYTLSMNTNQVQSKLPNQFMRIHRSHIVNLNEITGFDAHYVFFDDYAVPYSNGYARALQQHLSRL